MSLYFWEKEKSFANRGVKTASISPYSEEIKNIFTFHRTYVPYPLRKVKSFCLRLTFEAKLSLFYWGDKKVWIWGCSNWRFHSLSIEKRKIILQKRLSKWMFMSLIYWRNRKHPHQNSFYFSI